MGEILYKYFKQLTMALDMTSDVKINGPQQIVIVNSDGQIKINHGSLNFICNQIPKETKIYIISIVGSYSKAKSLLLSFFLKYLRNKVSVTKPGQQNELNAMSKFKTWEYLESAEDTSPSISMWPEIFHFDGVAVILMNTQCKINRENEKILSISYKLSAFQIVCLPDEIDQETTLRNTEKGKNDTSFLDEELSNLKLMIVEHCKCFEKKKLSIENYWMKYLENFQKSKNFILEKTRKTSEQHFVCDDIKHFFDSPETISDIFRKIGNQKKFDGYQCPSLIFWESDLTKKLVKCVEAYNVAICQFKRESTQVLGAVAKKQNRDQHVSKVTNKLDQSACKSSVEDPSSGAASSSANIHADDEFYDSGIYCEQSGTASLVQEHLNVEEKNMLEEYHIISKNGECILSNEEFIASESSSIVKGLDITTIDYEMSIGKSTNDPKLQNISKSKFDSNENTTEVDMSNKEISNDPEIQISIDYSNVESIEDGLPIGNNATNVATNHPKLNSDVEIIEEVLQTPAEGISTTVNDLEILQEAPQEFNGSEEMNAASVNENLTENETISENSMDIDENVEKFTHEIYRILSFPDFIEINIVFEFASVGFFWLRDNVARCYYCQSEHEILSGGTSAHDRERCPLFQQENTVQNLKILRVQQNMYYESHRILTFLSAGWPKEAAERYPVGCLELAKFGFFFKGPRDCARCAFCRLEVSGWEIGDTAHGEHVRWNRNCSFMLNLNVGNKPLGHDEHLNLLDSIIDIPPNEEIIPKASGPKHCNYADQRAREYSYETWPIHMTQDRLILSAAGFYYTGTGDRVVCFQCGGGLKDWANNDDPWVEHATWFPMCDYLLAKKGQNFVNAVQVRVKADRTKAENEKKERERQEFERAEKEKREKAEQEPNERPVAEVPMMRLCKVCLDRELGIVFLPCGHMSSCAECAPQLFVCPICRSKPAAYIRAYLP